MIYIITLLVLLFLVYHYDVNGNTRNRMTAYYILMFWYIAISGFQYCMGSDIIIYMNEYNDTDWSDLMFDSLVDLNSRQFGWILLSNICKLVSNDFLFFKIVQAAFLNAVIFIFLKKNTEAIFTSIFFYSIFLYLDLNFNILRQSFAIGFFLLGYRSFVEKKWLKYYLYVFIAILFHNSAIILFFIPLLNFIKINKNSLIIISSLFFIFLFTIRLLPISNMFYNYLMLIFVDSEVSDIGASYLNDDVYGINTVSVLPFIVFTILYLWVVIYYYLNNNEEYYVDGNDEKQKSIIRIFLIYILLYVLVFSVPIFARFSFYFTPFFIVLVSNFVINLSKNKYNNIKGIAIILLILIFSYPQLSSLFKINAVTNSLNIVQYYPYSSIFDKNIPEERYNFW